MEYNGALYFPNGAYGEKLWRYDGDTVAIVQDIKEGGGPNYSHDLTVFDQSLYFTGLLDSYGREV